ncbi:hypothetical protein SAMN04487781_4009 [Cellulosimicrobium cellulans]|nr:hypothetical protein SAMN04487781_4009 [Cellulosimicrobium cellulans]
MTGTKRTTTAKAPETPEDAVAAPTTPEDAAPVVQTPEAARDVVAVPSLRADGTPDQTPDYVALVADVDAAADGKGE